jgi:hypothetical protein
MLLVNVKLCHSHYRFCVFNATRQNNTVTFVNFIEFKSAFVVSERDHFTVTFLPQGGQLIYLK